MQEQILEPRPGAPIRVYAVWTNRQAGDSRAAWDTAGLTDRRVTHLWDETNVTGRWVTEHVDGYIGLDYDLFLLYGPDATWEAEPGPLLASGFTVMARRDQLQRAVEPLLD